MVYGVCPVRPPHARWPMPSFAPLPPGRFTHHLQALFRAPAHHTGPARKLQVGCGVLAGRVAKRGLAPGGLGPCTRSPVNSTLAPQLNHCPPPAPSIRVPAPLDAMCLPIPMCAPQPRRAQTHLSPILTTGRRLPASTAINPVHGLTDLYQGMVVGQVLGQGSYGTVYHGKWHGVDVAIKVRQAGDGVGVQARSAGREWVLNGQGPFRMVLGKRASLRPACGLFGWGRVGVARSGRGGQGTAVPVRALLCGTGTPECHQVAKWIRGARLLPHVACIAAAQPVRNPALAPSLGGANL